MDDVNLNKKFKLSGKMRKEILPNDPNGTKDMLGEGSSESLLSGKLIACMVEYIKQYYLYIGCMLPTTIGIGLPW